MSFLIVVFLQILFLIIIHGENTFDCTGYEDDSYHAIYDAGDCRHYWHCIYVNTVYMHAVKRVCPAGTEFHETLRQCETSSEVDCKPPKSPHMLRTSSTTKAWKWKYSKLFSRKSWKPTTTRKHPIFDLGDSREIETTTARKHPIFDLGDSREIDTTTMIIPKSETTEQIQVLPFTLPQLTTAFSVEQLSKNLHALVLNRQPSKHKSPAGNFFLPGEPENEAEVYTSTSKQRTRRTHPTTQSSSIEPTIQFSLSTFIFTTEPTTTTIATSSPPPHLTSTSISTVLTQPDTTIYINPQPRMSGPRRRNNMTLYILTSDDHKIRQFSINHTRGILVNCNQLRRRLLGRRRLRDILQTSTNSSIIRKTSSTSSIHIFHYNILSLTILSLFFLQK